MVQWYKFLILKTYISLIKFAFIAEMLKYLFTFCQSTTFVLEPRQTEMHTGISFWIAYRSLSKTRPILRWSWSVLYCFKTRFIPVFITRTIRNNISSKLSTSIYLDEKLRHFWKKLARYSVSQHSFSNLKTQSSNAVFNTIQLGYKIILLLWQTFLNVFWCALFGFFYIYIFYIFFLVKYCIELTEQD